MTTDKTYSIRDLAQEFEVTPRTLRFYEDKGLISPERRGTQRIYNRRDKGRLSLILRGKRLGFSLAEIRDWLDLYEMGDGQVVQARTLLDASVERMAALERQRDDLEQTISELKTQMQTVENWLASQGDATPRAEAAD